MEAIWNAIAPDGTTAALAALVGIAWRLIAGQKADQVRARVKEIARAAWSLAVAIEPNASLDEMVRVAEGKARGMLDRLKIPASAEIAAWLAHELDVLLADERDEQRYLAQQLALAGQRIAAVPPMPDAFAAAEARGRSRIDAPTIPTAIILCPEPRCTRRKGHAGAHGEWSAADDEQPPVSGEFETTTEVR